MAKARDRSRSRGSSAANNLADAPQPRAKAAQPLAKALPQPPTDAPQPPANATQPLAKALPQPRSRLPGAEGWIPCFKWLQVPDRYHTKQILPEPSVQLFLIKDCSLVQYAMKKPEWQAEVVWYWGGHSLVTMPTAKAEKLRGVYFGTVKSTYDPAAQAEEAGMFLDVPDASMTYVRMLGTREGFIAAAADYHAKGKLKDAPYFRLMEMLEPPDWTDTDWDSDDIREADNEAAREEQFGPRSP